MEKLSARKRAAIVYQYLSGLSYDEIAAKNGVSKGTVANVVADLKAGRFPEAADVSEHIALLRELSLDLRRSKLTPGQCVMGLTALTRINECGLDPADIGRWPLILKLAGSEDQAREFVRQVYSIQEVQKRTGLSLEGLDNKVHELEKKAADLEPLSKQHKEYQKQITGLTRQRTELSGEMARLEEKYKFLNPRVTDLEKREHALAHRLKDMEPKAEKAETTLAMLNTETQKLLDAGLSLEELAEFNRRIKSIAQRHQITPEKLRDRLLHELESLNQAIWLDAVIQGRQKELKEQERAVSLAMQQQEKMEAVVANLKREKASLEASIINTRETVSSEISKIIPIARNTINQFAEELRRGNEEALSEVRQLREEALEVGKEVGKYENILRANPWLSDLLALVQGNEGVEGHRVRSIVLFILRGAAAWLEHHKAQNLEISILSLNSEKLIKEIEQWKV